MAIGAMVAIREAGFSIPEDFAVVGYDDIPAAAFTYPPLTTIRSHGFEQGKLLGEAAIALMDGKEIGSQQNVVALELIIRASCGAKATGIISPASPLSGSEKSVVVSSDSRRPRKAPAKRRALARATS